jgi:hypothetical protein
VYVPLAIILYIAIYTVAAARTISSSVAGEACPASRLAQEAALERKRAELSEVNRNAAKPAVATARAKNTDDGYAKVRRL